MKTTEKLLFEIEGLSCEMSAMIKLAHIQSISEANVFWIKTLSPIILEDFVIDFLFENRNRFKRKLTIEELFTYDTVIRHFKPRNFSEFKELLK